MTTRPYLLAGILLLLACSCLRQQHPDKKDQLVRIKGTYSVQTILRKIEEQTGKRFFYSNSALDDQQKMTVNWDNLPLSDVLPGLLKNKRLHWNEKEKIVVLCPDSIHFGE
ncbi:hypothetical protein SAMN05518672_106167 [Chitinophaga sp. CF118]|uniref:STN domain-containing protein n=1 Tax=Chitinophaga sp. CF118 TaxID=1884367 RepID=UPI0008EAA3C7|nr:STN domain-containing protein [Chitinophaga sp. CF118]SFE45089.1 hypothetical protein SAMN05518672_106167 [Chitinophaga sp. CF118]